MFIQRDIYTAFYVEEFIGFIRDTKDRDLPKLYKHYLFK